MSPQTRLCILPFLAILVVGWGTSLHAEGILNQPAPELQIERWYQLPANAQNLQLKGYRGKVVYMLFFQSWCPGCNQHGFPMLVDIEKQLRDDPDVKFLAIQTAFEGHSVNTPERLAEKAKKFKLPIPFGHSDSRKGTGPVNDVYKQGGTPWVVIVDPNGIVRFNDHFIEVPDAVRLIQSLKKRQR